MSRTRVLISLVIVVGGIFYFSSDTKVAQQSNHSSIKNSGPQTPSVPSLLKKGTVKSQKSEAQSDCVEKLYQKSGATKCDVECFANFMKDKDPEVTQLIKENWLDSKSFSRNPRSRLGKFFQAMMYAGIDIGRDPPDKKNIPRSVAILRNLSEGEPENSYYLFFEAYLLNKLEKKEQANEVLRRAADLPSYRSPFNELRFRLLKTTMHDLRAYFKGMELYSALPYPSYKQLEELSELDEEAFVAIAKKMMEPALAHQGKFFEYAWNPMDYQLGKYFIGKISPGEADKFPRYNELTEFEWSDITSWDVSERGCNEEDFKNELKDQLKSLKSRE